MADEVVTTSTGEQEEHYLDRATRLQQGPGENVYLGPHPLPSEEEREWLAAKVNEKEIPLEDTSLEGVIPLTLEESGGGWYGGC